MKVFNGVDEAKAAVGQHLGHSEWLEITQERVDQFAEATGDHQWIHVDVERANAESPFGGPIAHGYLTLSLTSMLVPTIVSFEGFSAGINYGTNKVRFPSPVRVGSRVRASVTVKEVTDVAGGIQIVKETVIEVEGSEKPACVVEAVSRFLV